MKIENTLVIKTDSPTNNPQSQFRKVTEGIPVVLASPVPNIQNNFVSEMNAEKINDIKSKIASGAFQVNADAIAEKILKEKDSLKFLMG